MKTTFQIGAALSFMLFNLTSAQAANRVVQYYTFDTYEPLLDYQVIEQCDRDQAHAAKKLAEVSTALTGSADSLSVYSYYGRRPLQTPPYPNPGANQYESYCYLEYVSNVSNVGFNAYSAIRFTHLSSATWGTACKAEYDKAVADPNTVIVDYDKSATLFQGRICDVPVVKAVKN